VIPVSIAEGTLVSVVVRRRCEAVSGVGEVSPSQPGLRCVRQYCPEG
jgi:hypothetical protein